MVDRRDEGRKRVGMPLIRFMATIDDLLKDKSLQPVNSLAVAYYHERMIMGWLAGMIDDALDDEQLANLDSNEVRILAFLLIRDHFRQNASIIRPEAANKAWVEDFFEKVMSIITLPEDRLMDDMHLYDLDDLDGNDWSVKVASPLGIKAAQLFMTHSALVTGVQEDL